MPRLGQWPTAIPATPLIAPGAEGGGAGRSRGQRGTGGTPGHAYLRTISLPVAVTFSAESITTHNFSRESWRPGGRREERPTPLRGR